MTTSAPDSERTGEDAGGDSGGALPAPCPRFATRDEWEAWHRSLTWEQQLRRSDLDPPEHQHSAAEAAKADARAELRRAQRFEPDPFSYSDDRRDGPWPRVDQLEAPALSNTWRIDPACGYSPGGFARRLQQVPYCELIEERIPARAQRNLEVRLAWLGQSINEEEASLRAALKLVLHERHGRLSRHEAGATVRAMAWCHLLAGRCQLEALRELAKATHAERQIRCSQLNLF